MLQQIVLQQIMFSHQLRADYEFRDAGSGELALMTAQVAAA